jgi:integrase
MAPHAERDSDRDDYPSPIYVYSSERLPPAAPRQPQVGAASLAGRMHIDQSLRQLVVRAAERAGVPPSLAMFARGALADSTWKSYESIWRRFREFADVINPHTVAMFCAEVGDLRPGASIAQAKSIISMVCQLTGCANPFDDPAIARTIAGMVRMRTTEARTPGPLLDVGKVTSHIRAQGLRQQYVMAAIASALPCRPGELAKLRFGNLLFVQRTEEVGLPDRREIAHQVWRSWETPVWGAPYPAFYVQLAILDSKTDKIRRIGIHKILQHPHGDTWSPALAILSWTAARRPTNPDVFMFAQADGTPLSTATISNTLARVAEDATGVRLTGRLWRPAAATALLRAGYDVETVAALGGWASTDSLRKHYVRASTVSDEIVRRTANPFASHPPFAPITPSRREQTTPNRYYATPRSAKADSPPMQAAPAVQRRIPAFFTPTTPIRVLHSPAPRMDSPHKHANQIKKPSWREGRLWMPPASQSPSSPFYAIP